MKAKHLLLTLTLAGLSAASVLAQHKDRQYSEDSYSWHPELSKEGPIIISVSLKSQVAAVYRNGIRIGHCEVSSGKPGHETPTGVFQILNKDADHHSKTYGNASMPYSERLTWDGVALHAGGLPGYPSSHGCIHLPYEFAKKLFTLTHKGTTVVVSNDTPSVPVTSSHSLSFHSGTDGEFSWNPQASPAGPVSLLYSQADKKLYVIRNGHAIGECAVHTGWFDKRPKGTSAFVFHEWQNNGRDGTKTASWTQVGGHESNHENQLNEWFKMPAAFQKHLTEVVGLGTNLIVTNESSGANKRSQNDFSILIGHKEEKAE